MKALRTSRLVSLLVSCWLRVALLHPVASLSQSSTRREALIKLATATLLPPATVASAAASLENYNPEGAVTSPSSGRSYFPTLTPPFQNRATYRYELGRDAWALEQLLVFANVTATVRTIVVRMEDGG